MSNNGFFLTEKTAADLKRLIDQQPGGGAGRQGGRWAAPEWQAVTIVSSDGGGEYTGQILAFDVQANDWAEIQTIGVREFNGLRLRVGRSYPALRVSAEMCYANASTGGATGGGGGDADNYFCPDSDEDGPCNGNVASNTWQVNLNITSDTCPDCETANGFYTLNNDEGLSWSYDDENVTLTYSIFGNLLPVQATLSVIVKACADIEYVYELAGPAGLTEDFCDYHCDDPDAVETPEYSRYYNGTWWSGLGSGTDEQADAGDIVLVSWCCESFACGFMMPWTWTDGTDILALWPVGADIDLRVTGPFSSVEAAIAWGACEEFFSMQIPHIIQSLADGCEPCSPKLPVKCCASNTLSLVTDDNSCTLPPTIDVTPTVWLPCDETICSDVCCDGGEF